MSLAKIAGLSGLVVGVFYILYKTILSKGVLQSVPPSQRLALVGGLALLVWVAAMTALLQNDHGVNAVFYSSNGNTVQQNVNTQPK